MNPTVDFYRLLGVDVNASAEAIRQAYKRKALEWHPDKRGNDIHAENMFKEIKKAYETLFNDSSKFEYDSKREEDDDDNNNDILLQNMCQLSHGKRPSQLYEEKITRWVNEYSNYTFKDNFQSEMTNITKTIFEKYKQEANIICIRIMCPTCCEYHDDLHEHIRAMKLVHNTFLQKICRSTSLYDLLASLAEDYWSWKPIEPAPSTFKELWFNPHWSSFEPLIRQLLPAVDILRSTKTNFSPVRKKTNYAEVEKIVQSICEKEPIIHGPNLTPLKQLIDAEYQIYRTGSDANSAHYSTGEQICIVENPDRNEILSPLMLVVQSPPIKSSEQPKCSSCLKSFGIFRRRYWCRMCGNNQCGDCQTWQTCRHLGYTTPISICLQCTSLRKSILINTIFEHVQQLLNNDISNEHLMVYIHLLKHYCPSDARNDQLYKQASHYFLSQRQFLNAIQCYNLMPASHESWFKLAEILCTYSEYQYASLCFNIISEDCHYESHEWERIGDDYLTKSKATLALLSYRKANISIEEIWLKTLYEKKFNEDNSALFIFYTTFQKQSSKQLKGWTKWLGEQIQVEGYMLAAIFTLQLANFSTQEWAIVLNDLSDHNNFITVASVLRILNENLLNQIIASDKCTNHFLQLALQLLINGALGSVEKSLTRINYQSNIQQILFQLAVIHVFHLPDWQKVQNIFLPAEQCNQIIYCTKVCVLLRASSSLNFDWIQSGLESDQSIFYLLESLITNHSYMQLAVDHAKSKHIEIALNYYLLALNSSPQLPTVEAILSSASRLLSSSEALRCYIAVYKQMRTDTICALKALESLIDSFQTQKKPIISVLAAAVLTFDKSGNHLFKLYVQLLEELSKQFDENFSVIDAIHHFMNNLSTSTKSLSEKMQNLSLVYRQFLQTTVYKEVKQVVYENIIKLAVCLRDVTNIDALKHIRNEYFGNRDISTTPGEYRAKLYLIECMIARLENRNIEAVGKLNEAIAAYPVEDTTTAILTIMIDPSFHLAILKDLLNFVETLPIISEANSFASLVPPPPALFSAENLLKMNPNLRLLRKYERAILKRLNTDPLQSAFSYIDLCQAVHDPTCIVSNWTLACLYFYDLLSRTNSIMGKEAEVYAYRNVINELVSQAFLFSRVYLPPYMQIYIFRLLLPVVLQTAQIFRSSIARSHSIISSCRIIHEMVLPERENQLIYQLLNFTIHLTKVSPLIQLPTSLSFDILYREAVGQQFLVRFLEVMIEQDIEQSHLYEYYLFEGIWQGWARDHDFNKTRRTCMSAILDTKNWNMFDVQLLLDIPLIPRTDDGWLYRECRPLIFSSSQQFARIDGIAFDKNTGQVHFYFQPANNSRYGHNNALFDTVDVAEVFQRGLIQAIFTLNQPDNEFHAHPFQEMLYGPSSLLYTQYLATLLHTDYLLKMFTTGTEVCAKPPFEMRPIDEGFFERLPKHLQQKIQPLHKCDRYFSFGRAHRFWIEADEVIYEQQETDTSTIFWVADVRLRIRKHLLIRNSEGKLVDDENESEEEQRSAESLFAKAFTDHYDEIGIYFPELLRLKELLKLSALYAFARAQHQQLSKVVDYSPIMNHLTRVRSNLYEYPYNNYASVEKYYNQTLSDNGVSSWQVTSEQASELRSKIRQQLEQVDREVLDKLTQSLCEQTHTRVSNDVRALVKAWLDGYNNGTKDLAQFLAKEITNFHHQLKQPIEQLGIRLQHDDNEYETLKHPGESCNWVPAVFLSVFGSGRRIYGGVNLQLKLTEGYVPRNTSASTYNANNIFSNQSSIKSSTPTAGPRNNQERQNMRQELTQNSRRQTSSYGNNASGGGGNDRKPPKDPKPQPHWLPFGGEKDSRSETARAAHRLAKDQNRIPRSAQPEKVTLVKDRNPEARKNGKYNQFIRQYTYKNADGHLIDLRHDTPRTYAEEGGIGAQGPHVNAGPHGEKLHQHHWYGE